MRVKGCPGRKHAAWYLGCEDMILNPFRGFLFLFHHQCPKRCLRLSTNPSTLPPSSQKEKYNSFSPSSSSHLISTRCRTHSFPTTQRLVLTYLIPPYLLPSFHSPWTAPKSWTWGISWARFPPPSPALVASQAGQGLLSHSFPRGWGSTLPMPALWGHTLPSTSVTAWEERAASLQEKLHLKCPIHTAQADYNYKLKEKIKVPRLWFVFLSANCQLHEKLYFVVFFPHVAFTECFTLNQRQTWKNLHTEACL